MQSICSFDVGMKNNVQMLFPVSYAFYEPTFSSGNFYCVTFFYLALKLTLVLNCGWWKVQTTLQLTLTRPQSKISDTQSHKFWPN